MTISSWFTNHPSSVGESYAKHAAIAGKFALSLMAAGAACAVHAVLPWCFQSTGSQTIKRLHREMADRAPSVEH